NGYGIPKSNLERIFEPHFSTKTTSMGLGLAIVKKIIEEHQGTISVDSIENLGTTFTITLPKENPS
ncbi:MAG TPA: HAMP domain-containing sensor histidine kinase, partial [bacterium]|nr:HAMP domain-containing sensor histidine kinase [bacterium]